MSEPPAVDIRDLTYAYPDGTRALEDVSLRVETGERVAVIGANGAGKSTLLLHLNGILRSDGAVRIRGRTVEKETLGAVRQDVGLVFQNPDDQLFCPTVFDDVAFGPRNLGLDEDEVRERVERSLEAVGMEGQGDRSAYHLSTGEKKRASLATVLALDAAILALDEPLSNLDPRGRRELLELLGDLGRTQVVVTHDLDLVRALCQRAVVLEEGRVAADGETEAILADEDLLLRTGLA